MSITVFLSDVPLQVYPGTTCRDAKLVFDYHVDLIYEGDSVPDPKKLMDLGICDGAFFDVEPLIIPKNQNDIYDKKFLNSPSSIKYYFDNIYKFDKVTKKTATVIDEYNKYSNSCNELVDKYINNSNNNAAKILYNNSHYDRRFESLSLKLAIYKNNDEMINFFINQADFDISENRIIRICVDFHSGAEDVCIFDRTEYKNNFKEGKTYPFDDDFKMRGKQELWSGCPLTSQFGQIEITTLRKIVTHPLFEASKLCYMDLFRYIKLNKYDEVSIILSSGHFDTHKSYVDHEYQRGLSHISALELAHFYEDSKMIELVESFDKHN